MSEIILDMRRMGGKEPAHAYIARKLPVPGYYGRNLDALYDMLSGLPSTHIILRYSGNRSPESYQAKLIEVFADAAMANSRLVIEYR